MSVIRQLPLSVVNKIAAGEVIERPASVVKELLENSVDAGARRIEVTLGQGGTDLVRVADDGCGISAEDLPLAIASHATSKIADADDLFRVGTFGFRGEALASIAEVSQLSIRSRQALSDSGHEVTVTGGVKNDIVPCGCPAGTTIEIRNLFYNTPVRRKFLRASQTEIGHCSEAFTRIALAQPGIHFTLRHNDKLLFDLPPTANWRERIAAFFGRDIEQSLIPLDNADGDVRLFGFAADPEHSRANNRMQYLLLNGRFIRDRSLQHALGEAYRGLLLTGRFPIAFLRLDVPTEAVDVNVHPTKLEVRFADSGRIYSLLLGTIRKKFLSTDLTTRVGTNAAEPGADAADSAAAQEHRRALVDWAKGAIPAGTGAMEDSQGALELRFDAPKGPPLELNRLERAWQPSPISARQHEAAEYAGRQTMKYAGVEGDREAYTSRSPNLAAQPLTDTRSYLGFQVHNRYLITENEDGMVVIDQHALHERILYEQLREKVLAGQMEMQRLLVPEPVTLAPTDLAAALAARETLAKLGIEVEEFGGDTLLVSSYPAMLANLSPEELLRQVVELLTSSQRSPEKRDLLDELLHMIACKAAIKAGDYLAPEEITALLEQRHHFQDSHHCPHGRPTALVFTREELDRRFKRT
ncbi:MAG TPA: DNA mismatch repair endonuclease MutL [Pirellulaceae bacterium]|jgi:DNA mismatch repair protein MutL